MTLPEVAGRVSASKGLSIRVISTPICIGIVYAAPSYERMNGPPGHSCWTRRRRGSNKSSTAALPGCAPYTIQESEAKLRSSSSGLLSSTASSSSSSPRSVSPSSSSSPGRSFPSALSSVASSLSLRLWSGDDQSPSAMIASNAPTDS